MGSQSAYIGSHDGCFGKRRGRGEDSIYWDSAKERFVGAVSLGYSASGARVRKKVMGRTKTEVRDQPRPAPPGGALQHEHIPNPDDAAMLTPNVGQQTSPGPGPGPARPGRAQCVASDGRHRVGRKYR